MNDAQRKEFHAWMVANQSRTRELLEEKHREGVWGVGVGWDTRSRGFTAPTHLLFSKNKLSQSSLKNDLRTQSILASRTYLSVRPGKRALRPPQTDVKGGAEISLKSQPEGSIGCLVEDANNKRWVLSANHVIAGFNAVEAQRVAAGAKLYSPGWNSMMTENNHTIADLARWKDLELTPQISLWKQNNRLDAALGKPESRLQSGLQYLPGTIDGWVPIEELYPGMPLRLSGAHSGASAGKLVSLGTSVIIPKFGGHSRQAHFTGQLLADGMAFFEDSGSVVVTPTAPDLPLNEPQSYRAVGLAFGLPPRSKKNRSYVAITPWEYLYKEWGITPCA